MNLKSLRYLLVIVLILSTIIVFNSQDVSAINCYVREGTCSASNTCAAGDTGCKTYDIGNVAPSQCTFGNTEVCMKGCCCSAPGTARLTMRGLCLTPLPPTNGALDVSFNSGISTLGDCQTFCSNSPSALWNITGIVNGTDNHQIAGATVSIGGTALNTITNSTGGFTFKYISPNSYTITASWLGSECTGSTAFTLTSNKFVNPVISCNYYNITGFINSTNSADISGVDVVATVNGINYTDKTGTDGKYTLFNILKGVAVTITANKSSGGNNCHGSVDLSSISRNMSDVDGTNITMSCVTWPVSGQVYNGVNTVSNALITTNRGLSSNTNGQGAYNLMVPQGFITITASTPPTNVGGKTETCTNSTTLNVVGDTTADIHLGCCDVQCFDSQCVNGLITTTCTQTASSPGACSSPPPTTVKGCGVLPPCQWNCTDWAPSSCTSVDAQQTRSCNFPTTSSTCDVTINVPQPTLIQACPLACGNGVIDPGTTEQCDYNPYTGIFNANQSCIDQYKTASGDPTWDLSNMTPNSCNLNTCQCRPPPHEVNVPSCIDNPGNISFLNVSNVSMQHAFNLTWNLTNETCRAFVKNFELKICNDHTGNCFDVNDSIYNTTRQYLHVTQPSDPVQIIANSGYCYTLTVVFNDSVHMPLTVPPENFRQSITTCTLSGDEQCMNYHLNSWCDGNMNASCDLNNKFISQACDPGKYCTVYNGNAQCYTQGLCNQCNGVFGLFGYQGYSILQSGGKNLQCPSLASPNPFSTNPSNVYGCYMDYTTTSVDKAYSCDKVTSCYNYFSQSACDQDYCHKFNQTGASGCQWTSSNGLGNLANTFGKGVCSPKNESQQDCSKCLDDTYRRISSTCTQSVCGLYGNCYYSPSNTGSGSSPDCINAEKVTCETYNNPTDCTGGQNVSTNTVWNTDGTQKIDGTNSRIPSSDAMHLGVCYWDGTSCHRDADNNTDLNHGDCDSSSNYDMCQHDIIAPNTTINNRSAYGLNMDLSGEVSITDNNPWPFGNSLDEQDRNILLYYCIAPVEISTIVNGPNVCTDAASQYCTINGGYTNNVILATESGVSCNEYASDGTAAPTTGTKVNSIKCFNVSVIPTTCYPNKIMPLTGLDSYTADATQFKDALGNKIGAADNNQQFTMYYFSEDPAKNLEAIKNFKFTLDTEAPNISVGKVMNTFNVTNSQWLTNLTINLSLLNDEKSWPVDCSFTLYPPATSMGVFMFQGKDIYNIPSILPPYKTTIPNNANPLTTTYPELFNGVYTYDLHCIDSAKNSLDLTDVTIRIDGDLTIDDRYPSGQTFTSAEYDGNVSINTTAPGTCKYSSTTYDYNSMGNTFDQKNNPDGSVFRNSTLAPKPLVSGIYWYYVACNLTINGQQKIIRGDDADNINFAIDDLGPSTKLMYQDTTTSPLTEYTTSVPQRKVLDLYLACNDSDPRLNSASGQSMAFGCADSGKYYCIQRIDGSNDCTSGTNDYTNITSNSAIHFDYSLRNSANKTIYGNNPTIYYFSKDKGGNIGPTQFMNLHIKDSDLAPPNILFRTPSQGIITYAGSSTPPITDNTSFTIEADYADENSITLNPSPPSLVMTNNGAIENVLFEITTGAGGNTKFFMNRTYYPNGVYTLTLNATDDDGNNPAPQQITFTVQHPANAVHLISPPLGIGNTSSYDIELKTDYPSTCKYNDTYQLLFGLNGNYNNYQSINNNTDDTTHYLYNYTPQANGGTMYVICRVDGAIGYGDASYVETSFPVGYSSTSPSINITFIGTPFTGSSDNRIINASYNATIVQVFTNQSSVCMINRTDTSLYTAGTGINSMFNGEDQTNYSTYSMAHNITIQYTNIALTSGSSKVFDYNITCINGAQLNSTKNTSINFDLDSSSPTINATVDNTYITIKSVNVSCSDDSGCTSQYYYKIIDSSDDCNNYLFSSYDGPKYYTKRLTGLNNSVKVCLIGYDVLGNIGTNSVNVNVVHFNSGNLTVLNPYYYKDNHVYSATKTFNLSVNTTVNASCRYIASNSTSATDPATIYKEATAFTISGNFTHNITNFVMNSNPNEIEAWLIVCNVTSADPSNSYSISRELFFQWDNVSPVISPVTIIPPSIYDWNNRQHLMFIVNTDDETSCRLNGTLFDNAQESDLSRYDNYTTQHIFNPYDVTNAIGASALGNIDTNKNIPFNITCVNRAYLFSNVTPIVHYEINKNLVVTRVSGRYFNSTNIGDPNVNVPVNVTTNMISTCTLFVDTNNEGTLTQSGDKLSYSTTISVSSGTHTFRVDCMVPGTSSITPKSTGDYTVYADNDTPTIALSTTDGKSYTCSLNALSVNVNMNDVSTGIAGYGYDITSDDASFVPVHQTKISGSTSSISYPGTLKDGATYTITARAIDLVGRISTSPASISIIAHNATSSTTCDTTRPKVSTSIAYYSNSMAIVNVSCDDGSGSGCVNTFNYSLMVNQNSCSGAKYTSVGYKNTLLIFDKNGTLCVSWKDFANNANDTTSTLVNISPLICNNNLVDIKPSAATLGPSSLFSNWGDLTLYNLPAEQCDGTALNGASCLNHGFVAGTMSCSSACQLDNSSCVASMNNVVILSPLPFGIGQSSSYILSAGSQYNATCRYGLMVDPLNITGSFDQMATTTMSDRYGLTGLAGWWNFNEGSGTTAVDASGNGNTGILNNNPSRTTRNVDGALQFNGVNSYVSIPDSPSLDPTGGITISMWIYPAADPNCDGNNNWRYLLGKGGWGPYHIIFEEGNRITGTVITALGTYRVFTNTTTGAIPLSTWSYYTFTYDAATGTARAYINGALAPQTAYLNSTNNPPIPNGIFTPSPMTTSTSSLYINNPSTSCPAGSGDFNGKLDDVRVYNRALSAQEVNTIYASSIASDDMNVNVYYTKIDTSTFGISSPGTYLPREVICKMNNLIGFTGKPEQAYGIANFYVGYDTSAPNITVTTDKAGDTVNDWNDRNITLMINTNEPTACSVNGNPLEDFSDYGSYSTAHTDAIHYNVGPNQDITYNIICTNTAGLSTTATKTVHYNISSSIIITPILPMSQYDSDTTINFEVQTNLISACTINNGTTTQNMAGTSTVHDATINVANGWNTVVIGCSNGVSVPASKTYSIYGGAQGPQGVVVTVADPLCSLTSIPMSFSATYLSGSMSTYNYTITNSSMKTIVPIKTISSSSATETPVTPLTAGQQYTITATATDSYGYSTTSPSKPTTFTARNQADWQCDNTAPVMTITAQTPATSIYWKNVIVQCKDSYCTTFDYAIINQTDSCTGATYTTGRAYDTTTSTGKSATLTIDHTSKICVIGYDQNNNNGIAESNINVINRNNGIMWIISPTTLNNQYIISKTNPTNISVATDITADCKYTSAATLPADNTAIYSGATAFNDTGKTSHNITGMSITNTLSDWMFICKRNDVTAPESEAYITHIYSIMYDNTIPSITYLNATDVTDRWNKKSTLTITTDEPTVCYRGANTINNANTSNYNDYTTNHIEIIDYTSITDDAAQTFPYSITCVNRAGASSAAKPITINYNINDTLTLEKITPAGEGTIYISGNNTNLQMRTNLQANCSVQVNSAASTVLAPQPSTPTDVYFYYNAQLNNLQDTNTITVTCTRSGSTPTTATYTLNANSKGPTNMAIIAGDKTCSLTAINAQFSATATSLSIANFYYNITDVNIAKVISTGVTSNYYVNYTGNITAGHTYRIDAYAVDTASHTSGLAMAYINGTDSSSASCDYTSPTLTITPQNTTFTDLSLLNIGCSDIGGSGCTNTYNYDIIGANSSCTGSTYPHTNNAYINTLQITTSGKLCVEGTDKNNNIGYAESIISLTGNNSINITPALPSWYIKPNVIVTTTPTVNISLSTAVDADCRYSRTPSTSADVVGLYSTYIELNTTGAKTHEILEFDTRNVYSTIIDVICNSSNLALQPYSRSPLKIIYENTPPGVYASITPNIVSDWNSPTAQLSVQTDTNAVCSVTSTSDTSNTPYSMGNANDATMYAKNYYMTLTYDTNRLINPSYFSYNVSCSNFAGMTNSTNVSLSYSLSNTLNINMVSPQFYNTASFGLTISTNLISSCSMFWNNSLTPVTMTDDSTRTYHNVIIKNLTNATYNVRFNCTTPVMGLRAEKNYTITVNTSAPSIPVNYCGDGVIIGSEPCNGANLNGWTCHLIDNKYIDGKGAPVCNSACTGFDTTGCDSGSGYCGDGKVEPNSAGFNEVCDGNIPSWQTCASLGFASGTLSCTSNCQFNTSRCVQSNNILGNGNYTCGNGLIETGEDCEPTQWRNLSCSWFNYGYGTVACGTVGSANQCKYDLSGCIMNLTPQQPPIGGGTCHNGLLDTGEQCDGTLGLNTVSCRALGFISGNVSCKSNCSYDTSHCIGNSASLCSNGVKDIAESDVDCGGSCLTGCAVNKSCSVNNDCASDTCISNKCAPNLCFNRKFDVGYETDVDCGGNCTTTCNIGQNCSTTSDCTSGYCTNSKCTQNPCMNGVKDNDETDVDCGGSCSACSSGKQCATNSDCGSDSCISNVCAESAGISSEQTGVQQIKNILLILGTIFVLSGAGYIAYKTFYSKKSGGGKNSQYIPPNLETLKIENIARSKISQKQEEILAKKHESRTEERRELLRGLDAEKMPDTGVQKDGELKKLAEKSSYKVAKKDAGEEYIDISHLKSKGKYTQDQDEFHRLKSIGSGKNLSDKELFEKLDKISDKDDIVKKISKISGSEQADIKPALSGKLSHEDAIKMFGNLDKEKLNSNVFRDILSNLISSQTLAKEDVSKILFEYMDRGLLSKSDVARISSDLKII